MRTSSYNDIASKVRELDANLAHLPMAERDRLIRKELKLTRDELREFRGTKDWLEFIYTKTKHGDGVTHTQQ